MHAVSIICKRKRRGGVSTVTLSHSQHTLRENRNKENHLYHCLTCINKEAKMKTATPQELPRPRDSLVDHPTTKQSL